MPADYYEVLGVSRRREQRRHQACVPAARPRAASRREPRLARGRGALQGGRARLRGAARTPSGASATTGSAPTESPASATRPRGSAASATSSTRSSVERVRQRWPWTLRSAAWLRSRGRDRPRSRASGVRRASTRHRAHGRRVRGLLGLGRRRGNAARHVLRVQRHRPGPPGAAVDPRPDGHGRPMCRVAAAPARSSPRRARHVAARGARSRSAPIRSTFPRASTPAPRCGSPAAARSGPAAGRRGDLYVHVRVRPHDRFTRDRARPRLRDPDRVHPSRARHASHLRHARRRRRPRGARGHAVGPGVQAARPRRASSRGSLARGDVLVRVRVDTPTRLVAGRGRPDAPARRGAGRGRRSRRRRPLLEDPLRVQVTRRRAASARTSSSPTSSTSELSEADRHHLHVLRTA